MRGKSGWWGTDTRGCCGVGGRSSWAVCGLEDSSLVLNAVDAIVAAFHVVESGIQAVAGGFVAAGGTGMLGVTTKAV